mmetsp:Transcript_21495/g.66704  ORF Transcript_21495/g.66704 Transcript_21495/m.66704 type:complete len:356 (+) Transcript_21495:732-1799(+)
MLDRQDLAEAGLARRAVGPLERALHPLVVVGLKPQVARVHLKEPLAPTDVDKLDALDHCAVLAVHGALEVGRRLPLGQQGQAFHLRAVLLQRKARQVGRSHVGLHLDDLNLDSNEEAERAAAPRHHAEEGRMLVVARAVHQLARREDDVICADRLLDEAKTVRVGLHPQPHREAANRQVLHLDLNLERVPHREQRARDVSHVDEGLARDGHRLVVHLEDVTHVGALDLAALLFKGASRRAHREERLAVGAHLANLLARVLARPPLAHLALHLGDALAVQVRRGAEGLVVPVAPRPDHIAEEGDGEHDEEVDLAAVLLQDVRDEADPGGHGLGGAAGAAGRVPIRMPVRVPVRAPV